MNEARISIGWREVCSAVLLLFGNGFVAWSWIRIGRMLVETAALNDGKTFQFYVWLLAWPVIWFLFSAALLGFSVVLLINRVPVFAAVISLAGALLIQTVWTAGTM